MVTAPAETEVFETTDVEAVVHFLRSAYGNSMRIDPRGQRGGLWLTDTSLSPLVRFQHSRLMVSCNFTSTPLDVLAIGQLRDGWRAYRSEGTEQLQRAGDVFLAAQPGHPWTATSKDTDIEMAFIDPALLSQVADGAAGRSQQPVRLTGYEPVSPQAAQAWKATYAYIRDTVLASPATAGQPLFASIASQLLAATVLAVFPNNALTGPTVDDRHDAHPDTLRRAIAFIDDNAHTDITIADIAAASFVTIRAVQLAFRRHLDTTPLAYLRRVRLDHAHRDLLAADSGHDTVTAVAYRWGFPNPARFAAAYRQAYGVPPSHTLRHD